MMLADPAGRSDLLRGAPSDLLRRNAASWRSLVAAGRPDAARQIVCLLVPGDDVDEFFAEIVRQAVADNTNGQHPGGPDTDR